jgi:hypothetical protein
MAQRPKRTLCQPICYAEEYSDYTPHRPRKHYESGGALAMQKGHFCIWPCKINEFMSFTKWNGLYKESLLQQKKAFIQKYFFKWGILIQKKLRALFSLLKKVGGACPHCFPGSAAPDTPRPSSKYNAQEVRETWCAFTTRDTARNLTSGDLYTATRKHISLL